MQNREFSGQNILVTGGTRGIGKAIVKAFLSAGAVVWATYLQNDEEAQKFQNECEQMGYTQLNVFRCDIKQKSQLQSFFEQLDQKNIKLQVIIHNAGVKRDGLLASLNEEDWQTVVDTNLNGTFHLSQLSILHFLPQKYGRLIYISSLASRLGLPGQSNYAATKAAQVAMAKVLAKEVARKGITVNCVAPGFIATEMLSDMPTELIDQYTKEIPLKRLGKPEEVADAVLFLASHKASYITGTTLEVNGGLG